MSEYIYIKATAQAEGDLHLSDGATWAVSKALIKIIRIATSSTDWDLYILQNDNSYATDDANIPKIQVMEAGNGDANISLDLPYEDEDASDEVHLYYLDNSGANTADIYVIGTSLEIDDAILADTNELQTNQGNWITATGFSTPANVTAAQTAIIAEVDANETKIDSMQVDVTAIETDTNELQGLISSSKIAAQVKGMDAGTVTAAAIATDAIDADALKADAATEIATAVMAKVVDGTIDVTECMKIVLAVLAGDMAKSSNTYTYDDQSGTVKLTEVVSTDAVTRTIA